MLGLDWAALGEARSAMTVQMYLKEVERFMIDCLLNGRDVDEVKR